MKQAWYTQNLQIAIPVTVVAGILLLFLLWILVGGSYLIIVCDRKSDLCLLIAVIGCCKSNRRAMIKEQHLREATISSYTFSQPPMGGISRSGYVTYRALHVPRETDARLILPSAPGGYHPQSMSGDQSNRPK